MTELTEKEKEVLALIEGVLQAGGNSAEKQKSCASIKKLLEREAEECPQDITHAINEALKKIIKEMIGKKYPELYAQFEEATNKIDLYEQQMIPIDATLKTVDMQEMRNGKLVKKGMSAQEHDNLAKDNHDFEALIGEQRNKIKKAFDMCWLDSRKEGSNDEKATFDAAANLAIFAMPPLKRTVTDRLNTTVKSLSK